MKKLQAKIISISDPIIYIKKGVMCVIKMFKTVCQIKTLKANITAAVVSCN